MECCNNYINVSLAKEGTCGWGGRWEQSRMTHIMKMPWWNTLLRIVTYFFSLAEEEQTLWELLADKIERSIANGEHKTQADAPNKYRHIGQR